MQHTIMMQHTIESILKRAKEICLGHGLKSSISDTGLQAAIRCNNGSATLQDLAVLAVHYTFFPHEEISEFSRAFINTRLALQNKGRPISAGTFPFVGRFKAMSCRYSVDGGWAIAWAARQQDGTLRTLGYRYPSPGEGPETDKCYQALPGAIDKLQLSVNPLPPNVQAVYRSRAPQAGDVSVHDARGQLFLVEGLPGNSPLAVSFERWVVFNYTHFSGARAVTMFYDWQLKARIVEEEVRRYLNANGYL